MKKEGEIYKEKMFTKDEEKEKLKEIEGNKENAKMKVQNS